MRHTPLVFRLAMADRFPEGEFGVQVPNSVLKAADIPVGTRDWMTFVQFALSIDGYSLHGGADACFARAESIALEYRASRRLPSSIWDLRTALFCVQRFWRWQETTPDEESWRYIDALMRHLRDLIREGEAVSTEPTLWWRAPLTIALSRSGQPLVEDFAEVPQLPGIYLLARKSRHNLEPRYIGLSSRPLRRRLREHLRNERMLTGLFQRPRGTRLVVFATLDPPDRQFASRHLPSIESGLIELGVAAGFAELNTHRRQLRAESDAQSITFLNAGRRPEWLPLRVTVKLLPPRRGPAA